MFFFRFVAMDAASTGRLRLRSSPGSLMAPQNKTRMRQLHNTRLANASGLATAGMPQQGAHNPTTAAASSVGSCDVPVGQSGGGDPSVLRPSISVNLTGMLQAVKVLENGSDEVNETDCNCIHSIITSKEREFEVLNWVQMVNAV